MPKCKTESGIVVSLLGTVDSEHSKSLSQYCKHYTINTQLRLLILLKPGKDGVVGIMTTPRAHWPK